MKTSRVAGAAIALALVSSFAFGRASADAAPASSIYRIAISGAS